MKLNKGGMTRLGPVFKNSLILAVTYLLLALMLLIGINDERARTADRRIAVTCLFFISSPLTAVVIAVVSEPTDD